MGVAADDHVHARELGRDGLVGVVAQVGQQHDLVHPAGAQGVDGGLGGGGFVEEGGGGVGARGELGLVLDGEADHAHRLAAAHDDGGVGDAGGQRRTGRRADVGRQHGRLAAAGVQVVDELHEAGVGAVELVVAQGEGVEADGVHQHRVGLAFALGEVQVAGDGVAGVELEHVGLAGGELLDGGGNPREAAQLDGDRAAGAGGILEGEGGGLGVQVRVVVVDVQDAQVQRRAAVGRPAAGGKGEGAQGRRQGAQGGVGSMG